jgi:hypothetical protein
LKSEAQVHYLKVAELQRRGLVHFHVLVRADGPDNVGDATPTWLTTELLQQVMTKSIRLSSVVSFDGVEYRWGRLLDVQDLGATAQDANTVASYLAKYVTKTADGSKDLARQFKSRRQIQMLVDDPHARRLALTSWTMNLRPEFRALARPHVRFHWSINHQVAELLDHVQGIAFDARGLHGRTERPRPG